MEVPASLERDLARVSRIDVIPTILDVVCRVTGLGFAAVARVTEERWVACQVRDDIDFGLTVGGELPLATTFCHEVHQCLAPVIIDHVAADPVYRDHQIPALYGFQSYISMPIIQGDGRFFGTLCAIGPHPARLKRPEVVGMFQLLAQLIALHLDMAERMDSNEDALRDERRTAALREQFIAVLGHDLRNPLAAVESGVRLLAGEPLSDRGRQVAHHMGQSVRRMNGLVRDILDFARGRLGGGIPMACSEPVDMSSLVQQCLDELGPGHPVRAFETTFADQAVVRGDPSRLSQLISNLVANALTHGADGEPVRISTRLVDSAVELAVTNAGEPIAAAAMERLFHPFERHKVRPSQQGLGLGLYIAGEIAKAHGGEISVTSDAKATRFVFRMPASEAARGLASGPTGMAG